MSRIPDDVVLNILVRLPAKSLIRFRSVCKDWYSTIASPNFILTHLQLNPFKPTGYILLPSQNLNPCLPANVVCQSSLSTMFSLELPFTQVDTQYVKYVRSGHGSLVGSSQVLCFTRSIYNDDFGRALCLWNPRIKKSKSLTNTSLDTTLLDDLTNDVRLGFGFDVKSNDYKIVRTVFPRGKNKNKVAPQAEVYSLNQDSWRQVKFALEYTRSVEYINLASSPLVNGALHWVAIGGEECSSVVLSFCFDGEEFRLIMLPEDYEEEEALVLETIPLALNGSLALVVLCEEEMETKEICLRVMKKYGAVESWSKQIIIQFESVLGCCGCTEDGKLLINEFEVGLVSVDPVTLEKKVLSISDVESVRTLMDTLSLRQY